MVKMMLQDNLQQLDDNPSNKSDHVPHLLSPYYSAGQQCIEEVQQQQQQQHQERNSKVHVVLLGNKILLEFPSAIIIYIRAWTSILKER